MKLKGIELNGTYKVAFYVGRFEVYDAKSNIIYAESSKGTWYKSEYDGKGNVIYYEDSNGYIADKRIKELTVNDIEKLLGYKIKIKGENK